MAVPILFADQDLRPESLQGIISLWKTGYDRTVIAGLDTVTRLRTNAASAVQFNAADKSSLQIADAAQVGLDPGTSDFSLNVWVYLDSASAINPVVFKGAAGDADPGYRVYIDTSRRVCVVFTDGTGTRLTLVCPTAIALTTWTMVSIVFDRDGLCSVYLNGNSTADGTLDISAKTGNVNSTSAFVVGYYSTWFDGRMSRMAFWSKVLSEVERTALYASVGGQEYVDLASDTKTSLVSYWDFSEPTGRRWDAVGSNHLGQTFADKVTNGTFTGNSTGWTEGANWAYGTNNEAATAATADLSQSTTTAVVGKLYRVTYDIGGTVTGSVAATLGGVTGTTRTATGTGLTDYLRATATTALAIHPIAAFTGTIDYVLVSAMEILSAPGPGGGSDIVSFAASLDGSSQYLSYSGSAFNPAAGDFAVGCAFRLDKLPVVGSVVSLFSAGTSGAGNDYFRVDVTATGTVSVEFNDSSGAVTKATTATCSPGNWYTLVVNFDRDGNLGITLNNATAETASIAAKSLSCDPGNLAIGRYAAAASGFVGGKIAGPFYANRILTANEITWLHNGGKWRRSWSEFGVAATDGAALTSSAIKGFYSFSNAGSVGADSSGNGNTLTNNGTTTVTRGPQWDVSGTTGQRAVLVTSSAHGLSTGSLATVASMGSATYHVTNAAVKISSTTTLSYSNNGTEESPTADTAGRISHIAAATGDPITTWTDFKGVNNLAQTTLSKKPTLLLSAANGKNAVVFDGVDDLLTSTLAASITGDFSLSITVKLP